jgi:ADP-ribose pyrophosphatase
MTKRHSAVRPWKTLSSSTALDEKWFPVRKDTVQLPSGRIVDDYFVWDAPKIVMAVPVTPEGSFVMVRQYRHALEKVLIQFPGGGVDKDESPNAAAKRELEEETGYTSHDDPIFLGSYAPYPTKVTCEVDVYLIPNVVANGQRRYDDQEESEILLKTTNELLEIVDSKKVLGSDVFACAILALRYLREKSLLV